MRKGAASVGVASIERVTATAHGRHGVHAEVRGHRLTTDRPLELGGADRGLMASEHLLVALASCTCTSALKVAEKRRVPVARIAADAEMAFDERGEVAAIRLEIRIESAAPLKDLEKVVELAERVCTITKLLAFPVERKLVVLPERPRDGASFSSSGTTPPSI